MATEGVPRLGTVLHSLCTEDNERAATSVGRAQETAEGRPELVPFKT